MLLDCCLFSEWNLSNARTLAWYLMMTILPQSPSYGHQSHPDQDPTGSPVAACSPGHNKNIFEDEQRMIAWRDRFLQLCNFYGSHTGRDGSTVLNILYAKLYQDKWSATLLSPSIGLQHLQDVLLYLEKMLATSEAHKSGKRCVYTVDRSAFQNLVILGRLQFDSPKLESQHLCPIRLRCDKCAPLQPRLFFDDFPLNVAKHKNLTLPAWQPPKERLLDDTNNVLHNTISRYGGCKEPHDHTRHHLGRLQLLDVAEPVTHEPNTTPNCEIIYETVFHVNVHENSEQVTELMRLRFHVTR